MIKYDNGLASHGQKYRQPDIIYKQFFVYQKEDYFLFGGECSTQFYMVYFILSFHHEIELLLEVLLTYSSTTLYTTINSYFIAGNQAYAHYIFLPSDTAFSLFSLEKNPGYREQA